LRWCKINPCLAWLGCRTYRVRNHHTPSLCLGQRRRHARDVRRLDLYTHNLASGQH
jgi:hypothetical protein